MFQKQADAVGSWRTGSKRRLQWDEVREALGPEFIMTHRPLKGLWFLL